MEKQELTSRSKAWKAIFDKYNMKVKNRWF